MHNLGVSFYIKIVNVLIYTPRQKPYNTFWNNIIITWADGFNYNTNDNNLIHEPGVVRGMIAFNNNKA